MTFNPRSATAIRFPPHLHAELSAAAKNHGLSVNYLVVKAVEEFLENLLPPTELRLTRNRAPVEQVLVPAEPKPTDDPDRCPFLDPRHQCLLDRGHDGDHDWSKPLSRRPEPEPQPKYRVRCSVAGVVEAAGTLDNPVPFWKYWMECEDGGTHTVEQVQP